MNPDEVELRTSPIRRRRSAIALAAGCAIVVAAASCGGASDAGPTDGGEPGGESLYQANCASCHGSDLGGTDQGPSHLSIVYEPAHHGDDAFRSAVANGAPQHHWTFGSMPAISGLDDAQVDQIIAYIRSEQERQGFER